MQISASSGSNLFGAKLMLSAIILSSFLLQGCSNGVKEVNLGSINTPQPSQASLTSEPTPKIIQTTITQYSSDMIKKYPQLAAPKKGETIAIIETDLGTMKMKIFDKQVPDLAKNFTELAKTGKYTNVPFHRVIKDFMVQTGDFTNGNGTGGYSYKGPGKELPNQIVKGIVHLYGTVSMAKTSAPVSIGSQFFIVTNKDGTPFLDGGYSPIGQIYEGMEVAMAIQDLQIPGAEAPSQVVNIKKVTISKYDPAKP
ncbi:MAG: peptidylprolyl isomerase [Candidatus Gracilibacteria bacterium]|jgi:peptidyl-prolyl cis-trans isomerase B (cyclophilin B)